MDQDATQRNDTNQGFFSKIVFRLKGFLNTAPVSLKIGIFAGFLLFVITSYSIHYTKLYELRAGFQEGYQVTLIFNIYISYQAILFIGKESICK